MSQTVTPENTGRLLSPAEVAALANVSRKTIYREIDRGELAVLHVGRQLRIDPADFRRWLEGGTE
jgi:excisionase family DNA binding protein